MEFHFFVQVELLTARNCDLIAARNPELLSRGLRLVVGIAFNGAQRRIQPHGLLEPGGRCVETSDDVIAIILRNTATGCQALKSDGIDMARQHYPAKAVVFGGPHFKIKPGSPPSLCYGVAAVAFFAPKRRLGPPGFEPGTKGL